MPPQLFDPAAFLKALEARDEEATVLCCERLLDRIVEANGWGEYGEELKQEARIRIFLAVRRNRVDTRQGNPMKYLWAVAVNAMLSGLKSINREGLAISERGFVDWAEDPALQATEFIAAGAPATSPDNIANRELLAAARFEPRFTDPAEREACFFLQENIEEVANTAAAVSARQLVQRFGLSRRRAEFLIQYTLVATRKAIKEAG